MIAWLQSKAIAILGVGMVASVAFGGVQTLRIKALKTEAAQMASELMDAQSAFMVSEQNRDKEQAQAVASYQAASDRCEARVDQARKAASIIEGITNGYRYDAGTTAGSLGAVPGATRSIVPAGELRGIIGQAAGSQAAGVSSGSKPGAAR